jgi:hypothetical protein
VHGQGNCSHRRELRAGRPFEQSPHPRLRVWRVKQ